MTVRLTVDEDPWLEHIEEMISAVGRCANPVAVVKGNGYGFGRSDLAARAMNWVTHIAVGTVHELDGLPHEANIIVLTPTLRPFDRFTLDGRVVLTVGAPEHIAAIAGSKNRVLVKIETSMQRYGGGHDLVEQARAADLVVVGISIHPTLNATEEERRAEVDRILLDDDLATDLTVWVSHLAPTEPYSIGGVHPHKLFMRLGTALWHGERKALHLSAEVLQVRPVSGGDRVGYRQNTVPVDGHLVMVGAGTAHGVHPLPDGRSPFHHRRQRLDLIEPPHMHTSMLFVPGGDDVPGIGERLDLQRPITQTNVDEVEWLRRRSGGGIITD